jgi:ATPases of the AAA+ class
MLIIQEDVSSNHGENQEFADRYWSLAIAKTGRSSLTILHFSNITLVLTYAELQFDEALQLLSAPDPSTNHRTACELYEPNTCSWLVDSERFNRWLNSPSILLLSGIPGCGKTVLCSAAIERVRSHVIGKSGVGLAYFYFDFHEEHKQSVEGLLLSVIVQLVYQQEKLPVQFRSLCDDFKERRGKLRGEKLLKAFHATTEKFRRVYLILDALDECGERQGIMNLISNLVRSHAGYSILATSRDTTEISRSALGQVSKNVIYMSLDDVNMDIRTYVVNSLSRDPKLRERPNHVKAEIEAALTSGSHGM